MCPQETHGHTSVPELLVKIQSTGVLHTLLLLSKKQNKET